MSSESGGHNQLSTVEQSVVDDPGPPPLEPLPAGETIVAMDKGDRSDGQIFEDEVQYMQCTCIIV